MGLWVPLAVSSRHKRAGVNHALNQPISEKSGWIWTNESGAHAGQGFQYVGYGPTKDAVVEALSKKECPVECRPEDHQDWLYCQTSDNSLKLGTEVGLWQQHGNTALPALQFVKTITINTIQSIKEQIENGVYIHKSEYMASGLALLALPAFCIVSKGRLLAFCLQRIVKPNGKARIIIDTHRQSFFSLYMYKSMNKLF